MKVIVAAILLQTVVASLTYQDQHEAVVTSSPASRYGKRCHRKAKSAAVVDLYPPYYNPAADMGSKGHESSQSTVHRFFDSSSTLMRLVPTSSSRLSNADLETVLPASIVSSHHLSSLVGLSFGHSSSTSDAVYGNVLPSSTAIRPTGSFVVVSPISVFTTSSRQRPSPSEQQISSAISSSSSMTGGNPNVSSRSSASSESRSSESSIQSSQTSHHTSGDRTSSAHPSSTTISTSSATSSTFSIASPSSTDAVIHSSSSSDILSNSELSTSSNPMSSTTGFSSSLFTTSSVSEFTTLSAVALSTTSSSIHPIATHSSVILSSKTVQSSSSSVPLAPLPSSTCNLYTSGFEGIGFAAMNDFGASANGWALRSFAMFAASPGEAASGQNYVSLVANKGVYENPQLTASNVSLLVDPRAISTPIVLRYSYKVLLETFTAPWCFCTLRVSYDAWVAEEHRLVASTGWKSASVVISPGVVHQSDATINMVVDCAGANLGDGMIVHIDEVLLEYQTSGSCIGE